MVYDTREAALVLGDAANTLVGPPELGQPAAVILEELRAICEAAGFVAIKVGAESGFRLSSAIAVGDGVRASVYVTFVGGAFHLCTDHGGSKVQRGIVELKFDRVAGIFHGRGEEEFLSPVPGGPVTRPRSALAVLAEAVVAELKRQRG
jgi:hypothetical protein